MWIVSWKTLREFAEKHPDVERSLRAWREAVDRAPWKTPQDVKSMFGTADFVANNRVIFNIKGNHYRLVVKIQYESSQVFVRFIGTHKEYDGIRAEDV